MIVCYLRIYIPVVCWATPRVPVTARRLGNLTPALSRAKIFSSLEKIFSYSGACVHPGLVPGLQPDHSLGGVAPHEALLLHVEAVVGEVVAQLRPLAPQLAQEVP